MDRDLDDLRPAAHQTVRHLHLEPVPARLHRVEVQRTATGVNLSTVYRTLEVLEDVGLVTHAHIGHGPPTYHAVDEHVHIHLVCDRCGKVLSVPAHSAEDFVARLESEYGFRTDISHVSVHGLCESCLSRPKEIEPDDAL